MNTQARKSLLVLAALLISAGTMAQVTGTGTANTVPLWTSSSTQGNSSITENSTTKAITVAGTLQAKGSITAPQLNGTLGELLYHASFQGASQSASGNLSGVTVADGVAILQAGNTLGATANLQSDSFTTTSSVGPNKAGSFLSLRLKALTVPVASDSAAYFVAGGDVEGSPLRNGFGFKYIGGVGLVGVSIGNGTESVVNLHTTLSGATTSPPVDLLAIFRGTSVQFYVNGVSKGTITTNPPSSSDTVYELRLVNGTSEMDLSTWIVSYLTVGLPAQGAPPAGSF